MFKESHMTTFIQLSDLHIHEDMKRDDNVNTKTVVAWIKDNYKGRNKPAVLITGDIADDGRVNQFKNAVTLLRPLVRAGFTVLPCPGNHDYGKWGMFYNSTSPRYFRRHILQDLLGVPGTRGGAKVPLRGLYPMVTTVGKTVFIGLDSVIGNKTELVSFASGEIGKRQLSKLDQILKLGKHKNKTKVVYLHHHPFVSNITMELDDARKLMRVLCGRVDFLCFGHKHVSNIWFDRDYIDCVFASRKTPEKNPNHKFQFRHVTINGDSSSVSMVSFKT